MQARAFRLVVNSVERAFGSVLAADARSPSGDVVLRKGTALGPVHRSALDALVGIELHLVDLDEGELTQDEVARRLARAVAGPGTKTDEPRQGQVRVRAATRGLLRVNEHAVRAVNALELLLCFTQPDGHVVLEGDEVAGVKGASLATPERLVMEAEELAAGEAPLVAVVPFLPRRARVLVTDRLEPKSRALVAQAVRRKLAFYGSRVLEVTEVAYAREAVAAWLGAAIGSGTDLVLVSGANSLDPLDPVLLAIGDVGGEVSRPGVPAHPGSMVWVGTVGHITALGIATCAGFGKNTSLDVLLARLLAGEEPGRAVDELGHGGFLEGPGADSRFPPYDRAPGS